MISLQTPEQIPERMHGIRKCFTVQCRLSILHKIWLICVQLHRRIKKILHSSDKILVVCSRSEKKTKSLS